MIDPAVERQYSDCRELIAHWKTFFEFFSMGVKGENLTPEKESQFMQLKSRVAELHDSFLDALTHDHNIGQGMLDIVARSITLKHLSRLSTADVKKMEIEWHESYLLLNDTIGQLEDKRAELAQISEAQYKSKKAAGVLRQKVTNFVTSFYFKAAMVVAAFLFLTIGLQAFGIFDWDELGKQKWAAVPYRWGKLAVRKVWNEDSEWVDIENPARKPHISWPSGIKVPNVVTTDPTEVGNRLPKNLPRDIVSLLSDNAKQYRLESTTRGLEGDAFIHTILLPRTSLAKDAVNKFRAFADTPEGKKVAKITRLFRDGNVVTVVNSEREGIVHDIYLQVYEQPDIY